MTFMGMAQLLGNFGEFFGAVAVVVTLIFLTVQLRQNTRLAASAMISFMTRGMPAGGDVTQMQPLVREFWTESRVLYDPQFVAEIESRPSR